MRSRRFHAFRLLAAVLLATPMVLGGLPATASAAPGGAVVSGTVADADGNPLANVQVHVDDLEHDQHGWAMTGLDGTYTTGPVPPGEYRVQFDPGPGYAIEFWDDATNWDAASVLDIEDTSPIPKIDATLAPAAQISGAVIDEDGAAVAGACAEARISDGDDWVWVRNTTTDAAGNYVLDRLPAGDYHVSFEDCDEASDYLIEYYDSTHVKEAASTVSVSAGQTRPGIDAQLDLATRIEGTVTDEDGTPIEDICVQATSESAVGGMDKTDADGNYQIRMATGGSYTVQFADCGNQEDGEPGGRYLAEWYGGSLEPSSAEVVTVATGGRITGIGAALADAGGTATVSGRVTDVRGEGLASCLVLYMPDDAVWLGQTGPDGSFTFANVPTGTWTLGYLGCGESDISPFVPDAGTSGVSYPGNWIGGALVDFDNFPPDPVAQGADFITLSPGEVAQADTCFGCGSVQIAPVDVGADDMTVTVLATGLTDASEGGPGVEATYDYGVHCTSETGTPASVTAPGPRKPDGLKLVASGFTPGAPYVCSAGVSANGSLVANSASFEVTVGEASSDPADTGTAGPSPSDAMSPDPASPDTTSSTPAELAFTGTTETVLTAVVGLLMLIAGLAAVKVSQRPASDQRRRRATS